VRTPRPAGGCHQCCTSPSRNWRAAARSRCSRVRAGCGVDQCEARPAAGRGNRRRRRTGRIPCVPRAGSSASGTGASRSPSRSPRDRVCRRSRRRARGSNAPRRPRVRAGRRPDWRNRWMRVCTSPGSGRLRDARWFLVPGPSSRSSITCTAPQGSSPAPALPESRTRRSAAGWARVPLRPMNSLRSPVTVRAGSLTSRNTIRPANSVCVGVAGEQRAGPEVHLRLHVEEALGPEVAEHPFPVAGHGDAGAAGPKRCAASAANFTGASIAT
jgi:hypothetical protein